MKLITKKIEKLLAKYPIHSQEGKGKEAVVLVKFFLPEGAWTWYIMEADEDGDTLFGICVSGPSEAEYGYFSLQELQSIRSPRFRLPIERDLCFNPKKIEDIKDSNLKILLANMHD